MTVHLAHLKLRSEFCITGILCNVTIRYNVTMQQQLDVFLIQNVKQFEFQFSMRKQDVHWTGYVEYNFCKINQSYRLVTNRLCKQI